MIVLAAYSTISCTPDQPAPQPAVKPAFAPIGDTYSNIRPADYVGPATCGECHEKITPPGANTPTAA